MVLPFVTIIAKVFFCSLADRHQSYRSFFIWFLVVGLIGFGSFGILPFFIQTQPKELGLIRGTWVMICVMTSVSIISMGVITCLSDAFAMNSARKNNTSYGNIRLWGTLGWGLSSVLLAFINQTNSLPLLVPGLIMLIILIFVDILMVILWPNRDDFQLDETASNVKPDETVAVLARDQVNANESSMNSRKGSNSRRSTCSYDAIETSQTIISCNTNLSQEQRRRSSQSQLEVADIGTQWMLFKEVAKRRKSIYRYMALFTLSGALISLQWSYFFLFLKDIYAADFAFITGLSMVGQSIIGELPFFMLSKHIVKFIGRSHTLSLSMISIGLRYLLYEYLLTNSSMYFVLLTESLQGPSFGLFYVVMTEVGLDYSDCEDAILKIVEGGKFDNNPEQILHLRQALRATMQSLMSSCYEGLGLGVGSIIGGLVIERYGFSQLWLWAAVVAIVVGVSNLVIETTKIPFLVDRKVCQVPEIN